MRAEFNGPFQGIVFSKGTYGQDNCVYVKPYSSVTHTTFKVYYDQCGTKPDLQGKYYENTIVIQYGTDIIEAWDEAKRLRCEWFEAYEKPATFRPAIPVADLDVVEMNFQGDDIDCWMEIQEGKGPWAREVSRIVPVGQPMTIVVSINDYNGQFDMRVKSCFAHDGVKQPIQLTDEHGCVLRPKMLTPFNKVRDNNGKATVISYSHFYAFKFPDTMNVQIQCTIEVCRHGCPDACQKGPYPTPVREIHSSVNFGHQPQQPRQPTEHDQEPHPVYQELPGAASRPQPAVQLPGIPDQDVNAHATRFLEAQGVDLHKLRAQATLDKGEETKTSFVQVPAFDNHRPEQVGAELELIEDESKPVIKVVEIDVPADKKKAPTISEQPAVYPSDLDQASKLLSNLGLNVDLNTFAQGFIKNMHGNKDISDLLNSDRVREIAAANGVKLPQAAQSQPIPQAVLPEAQPLVNGSSVLIDEPTTTTAKSVVYEPSSTSAPVVVSTPTQPQPQLQHHQHQYRPPTPAHHPPQYFHHQPPPRAPRPPQFSPDVLAKLHAQQQPPQHQFGQPVAQVMNIPLSPVVTSLPPSFTNFVAAPHAPPQPPKQRPLFFGGFNLPTLRLPSIFGGGGAEQRKDGQPSGPVTSRPQHFPHGPRAMRLKRSAGSEISVNRRFQVVTAIDLAFMPNATDEALPQAIDGRREEVVYGVCLPTFGFAATVSCVLCVIMCALAFSIASVVRLRQIKRSIQQRH